jgi:eukaryotic-like serine/threonine-protein kinase
MSAETTNQLTPLPGYKLIKRLGRGGFGEVWEVEAPGGIRKAMKFVYGDLGNFEDENIRAAEQELKSLERVKNIRHPYILTLEQWTVQDGHLIIVMELADKNLWDRFKECRGLGMVGIPRDELMGYLYEAAEALDLMNDKFRIQHLDIKPQNLFLLYNHVKVADFGLAKVFEGGRGTVTGGVTPVYAGPETFEGYVSRYTDQYSLAIVFQELLTGTRPFNGSNTKQLVMQHLNGTPDLDHLPAADRPVIAKALAKKPEDRWPNCSDMVRALKTAHASTVTPNNQNAPVATQETPLPTGTGVSLAQGSSRADSQQPEEVGIRLGQKPLSRTIPPPMGRSTSAVNVGNGASGTTPWPLNTPRLVTPQGVMNSPNSAPSLSPAITLQRPLVVQTARMNSLGLAPPEQTSDGVLRPAIIVGIGHTGLLVIRSFKRILRDFWGPQSFPHVRFLFVDTDPESQNLACDPNLSPEPLLPSEVFISRLNRVGHYLQQDNIPAVDTWMPPGLLFKLPRNPGAASNVRAFGRISLMDNYRQLAQRIRNEIETFISDEPLNTSISRTKLGLRSTRAVAYVVANMAGGTGSGMFIDLAYILKNELRQIGYSKPDCIGLLQVPPADKTVSRGVSLANTYAAMTELAYFHSGKNKYHVRYANNEPPIIDSDSPFSRCSLVQLSGRVSADELGFSAGQVARSLYFELFSPLGRTLDSLRQEAKTVHKSDTPVVQAASHYRLSWPRSELLIFSTQRLAQRLLQRWITKDSDHLREPISRWLDEQWESRNLGLEIVVEKFNQSIELSLRESPDRVFEAFVSPLRHRTPGAPRLDADAAFEVLQQLLQVVGQPENDNENMPSLARVVSEQKELGSEVEAHLSAMAVAFIEQPQYRLSGTEEAIAQIVNRLKRTIDSLQSVRSDVNREVRETYTQLVTLLQELASGGALLVLGARKAVVTGELLDCLEAYPKKRLKLHILDATISVYRSMLASAPEYGRDVDFCRSRLNEIINTIPMQKESEQMFTGPGRMILPHGVEGIDGAADLFLGALPLQDLLDLDTSIQKEIVKKFRSLVSVCIKEQYTSSFLQLIFDYCREFIDSRLQKANPATMFFRHRNESAANTPKMFVKSFEESAPDITSISGKPQLEATVLALPKGPESDRFRAVVESVLPDVVFQNATTCDDIVFLREYPLLPLNEIPQLSDYAKEVYKTQLLNEVNPHTRCDIQWQ